MFEFNIFGCIEQTTLHFNLPKLCLKQLLETVTYIDNNHQFNVKNKTKDYRSHDDDDIQERKSLNIMLKFSECNFLLINEETGGKYVIDVKNLKLSYFRCGNQEKSSIFLDKLDIKDTEYPEYFLVSVETKSENCFNATLNPNYDLNSCCDSFGLTKKCISKTNPTEMEQYNTLVIEKTEQHFKYELNLGKVTLNYSSERWKNLTSFFQFELTKNTQTDSILELQNSTQIWMQIYRIVMNFTSDQVKAIDVTTNYFNASINMQPYCLKLLGRVKNIFMKSVMIHDKILTEAEPFANINTLNFAFTQRNLDFKTLFKRKIIILLHSIYFTHDKEIVHYINNLAEDLVNLNPVS